MAQTAINETELFVHIGYHKTASTFLQRTIFPLLPLNLVLIPRVRYLAESENYEPQHFIHSLDTKYRWKGHDKSIISQEGICGRADGDPLWDPYLMARRLKQTFPTAKILIVVREQIDYVLSLYTFRVIKRGHERLSLSDYLERKFANQLYEKLQYDKLVRSYQDLFGADNVLILAYEQLVADHRQFVARILDFMQLNVPIYYEPHRINVGTRDRRLVLINRLLNFPISLLFDSLRDHHLLKHEHYAFWANRYFDFKRILVNPVLYRLLGREGPRLDFDKTWRQRFSVFKESNRRLATSMGVDLGQYGYIS